MRALLKWAAAGLLLVAAILVPFLVFGAEIEAWVWRLFGGAGQAGLVLAMLIVALLALDVLLPIPSIPVSVAAVAAFGWAGGLLIWLGMTIGCGLGYWLGSRAGRPLAIRFLGERELARAHRLAGSLGTATLVLTRAVPVLAEAATLAAGLAAMPFRRFAAATALANAGIALVFVGAGSAAATSTGAFLMLAAAAVALPSLAWLAFRALQPA
ncbi:MAG TPA: VTT domain-containing protein [Allosphingosinicella sp.]|nr:VTT domain-containing protein [Allosphingosinicella sp.]